MQIGLEQLQVKLIIGAVFQADVQIALLFMERIIVCAMHAEGEHAWLLLKDAGCAISLVHIEVNDKDLFGQLLAEQVVGGHSEIIEQAEAFTMIRKCMMCATGHIQRHAMLKCMMAAIDGVPVRSPVHAS